MSDLVFQEATPELDVFVEGDSRGTGFKSVDDFISARAGLMVGDEGTLKALAIAQHNVTNLDRGQMRNYIDGLVGKTLSQMRESSLNYHADRLDIEGGVRDQQELNEVESNDTEVKRLAAAAPKYLDQFSQYSIPREVARRNYIMVMFAKKMEEVGVTPETLGDKLTAFGGMLIPGRQALQVARSDHSLVDSVRRLHGMQDTEFFGELPGVLDEVMKMSGNNPFIFMDRVQMYLDPDDITAFKILLGVDVIDAATVIAAAPKLLKVLKLARATNTPIKLLRDTGQVKKAAELNAAAMGDEAAASTLKIEQMDAAQSTSPFGGEGLNPNITERLAAETQALIAEQRAAVKETLAPLHDDTFLIRRSEWKPAEKEAAQAKYLGQFAGEARVIKQLDDGFVAEVSIQRPNIWPNKSVLEAKILELEDTKKAYKDSLKKAHKSTGQTTYIQEMIDQTRDEITRYERILERVQARPEGPMPIEVKKVKVLYRNNDFGGLEAIEYDQALRHVTSPSTYMNQMESGIVERATKYDYDTSRIIDIFLRARAKIVGGLKKKSKQKLDSILLQGDRDQVTYNDIDLINGVRTPDGFIKLDTVEEFGAYYSIRDTFEALYQLKNRELRRQLELGGFNAVHFTDVTTGEALVNFVNPNRIVTLEERQGIKRIFKVDTNEVVNADTLRKNPDGVLNQEIYKLKYPMEVGDEIVNYIVSPKSSIKELPEVVLRRREGYVPKIDQDIFYVAEMIGDKLVDGVVQTNRRTTVRYFDNPKDAETWSLAQNAKGQTVQVRAGREWLADTSVPGRIEEFEANIFGGLYGGKRAEQTVPFGLEGTEAERLGGIEAMEAYMNHIASRMPVTDFRAGLIQRFLNSAGQEVNGKWESFLVDPSNWRSEVLPNIGHKQRSGLLAAQNWVADQLRIPTTEERVWGNLSQKIAEVTSRVPGKAGSKLSKWSMQIGAKDKFTQMRGLAFHATLGWFNPSQFMVQAMGASLAASMHPLKAAVDIPRSLALRASMFAQSDEAIKAAAKAALLSEDVFLDMVKAYRKTGLHESTLSTGDYAALQGMPQGLETLRWVADKGLIFFKEGERWARNYAWIRAWDEVTQGGKIRMTDAITDQVTDLHLKYTLNLNRANRAHWQKGWMSIPTQFFQISAKFIENMLPNMLVKHPNGWTGKEKSMILVGQLAMFGAAGIPYGRTMYKSMANYLQSDDEYGLAVKDTKVSTAIQGGLTELLLYNWTGERLDVTNRLSIPAGIESMIEIMTSDQHTTMDAILGVSGSVGSRSWEATRLNARILYAIVQDPSRLNASTFQKVLDQSAQVISSYRNYRKAQVWQEMHMIVDRYGNRIIPINDDKDFALLFAQKLGVAPKILSEYYAIKRFNKNTEQDYRDAATAVIQISNYYYNDPEMITNVDKQDLMGAEIAIALLGFEDKEKTKILEMVHTKMSKEDFALPLEMEKALDNMYNKESASDLQGNTTMIDAGE